MADTSSVALAAELARVETAVNTVYALVMAFLIMLMQAGFAMLEAGSVRDRGVRDVNTRNRWVRFDGRYVHEVLPYTGTRYSVVYFQLVPPFDVDPSSTEEGQ